MERRITKQLTIWKRPTKSVNGVCLVGLQVRKKHYKATNSLKKNYYIVKYDEIVGNEEGQ